MTDLEERICNKFKVNYGIFTGNGTTAMYLTFLALGKQNKKVVFPAISCTNPVNAAIFAGYDVDFCDVRIEDYTIDIFKLEKMLQTGKYGIIVPTHIYGHRYDEKKVRKLCNKYDVMLFEDAAQSFYIGDMDVAVMSFGHTKAYETAMGGGVTLTNNKDIYDKILYEKNRISHIHIKSDEAFDEYREVYYRIVKSNSVWEKRNIELRKLQLSSDKYFIFDMDENKDIINRMSQTDKIVKLRCEKTRLYQEMLDDKYTMKPDVSENCRWRYTFLYLGDREYLLEQARKYGIDISSWYFSLAGIYKNQHLENADKIESQIVNLWVDESHDSKKIENEITILNKIMENDYARCK